MNEIELAHAELVQQLLRVGGAMALLLAVTAVVLYAIGRGRPLVRGDLRASFAVLSFFLALGLGISIVLMATLGTAVGGWPRTVSAGSAAVDYLSRHHDATAEELRAYICTQLTDPCSYTVELQRTVQLRDETVTLIVGARWTQVRLFGDPWTNAQEQRYSFHYASSTTAQAPEAR